MKTALNIFLFAIMMAVVVAITYAFWIGVDYFYPSRDTRTVVLNWMWHIVVILFGLLQTVRAFKIAILDGRKKAISGTPEATESPS